MRHIEFYKYTDAKSLFFCRQKLQKSDICVYVEPSATASAATLAAVGATLAAVGAAIPAFAAATTAAVSASATIAVSAATIAGALWLIVVCPCYRLCFCLPLPLPAPAIAAVVCRHHCHCCCHRNCCPCSFCHHRHHRCLFFCRWLCCLYVSFLLLPCTTTYVSTAAMPPLMFLMPSSP